MIQQDEVFTLHEKKIPSILHNKRKFVLVKRILLFLSIILLTTANSKGQTSREPSSPDVLQRILKVYPNPATTFTKFEFQKSFDKGYTLKVINFIGKQVF